jgi:hypothetical protein
MMGGMMAMMKGGVPAGGKGFQMPKPKGPKKSPWGGKKYF